MRLSRFIITGIIITVLAVGFVHQHVEIVKTGYILQENREYLSCLIDQNSKLMYDLSKLESPRYLLASLDGEEMEFAKHNTRQANSYRLVRAGSEGNGLIGALIGKLLDLFTLNAEAGTRG